MQIVLTAMVILIAADTTLSRCTKSYSTCKNKCRDPRKTWDDCGQCQPRCTDPFMDEETCRDAQTPCTPMCICDASQGFILDKQGGGCINKSDCHCSPAATTTTRTTITTPKPTTTTTTTKAPTTTTTTQPTTTTTTTTRPTTTTTTTPTTTTKTTRPSTTTPTPCPCGSVTTRFKEIVGDLGANVSQLISGTAVVNGAVCTPSRVACFSELSNAGAVTLAFQLFSDDDELLYVSRALSNVTQYPDIICDGTMKRWMTPQLDNGQRQPFAGLLCSLEP